MKDEALRKEIREYLNQAKLNKERLALGSEISVRTIDEFLGGRTELRPFNKTAIIDYLAQHKKKTVA